MDLKWAILHRGTLKKIIISNCALPFGYAPLINFLILKLIFTTAAVHTTPAPALVKICSFSQILT